MTEINTIVHKANLALRNGESIGTFTEALGNAAREAVHKSLKLSSDDSPDAKQRDYTYPAEVFAESVVMSVSRHGKISGYGYYSMDYTRDADGQFKLGNPVEVRLSREFKPAVNTAFIKKSAGGRAWVEKRATFAGIVRR